MANTNLKRSLCHPDMKEVGKKMKVGSAPDSDQVSDVNDVSLVEHPNLPDPSLQNVFNSTMMNIIQSIGIHDKSKSLSTNDIYTQTPIKKHYEKTTQAVLSYVPRRLNVATQTVSSTKDVACQTLMVDSNLKCSDSDPTWAFDSQQTCESVVDTCSKEPEASNSVSDCLPTEQPLEDYSNTTEENYKCCRKYISPSSSTAVIRESQSDIDCDLSSSVMCNFATYSEFPSPFQLQVMPGEQNFLIQEGDGASLIYSEEEEKFANMFEENDFYEQSIVNDEKFVVFESSLFNLCQQIMCPVCSLPVYTIDKSFHGSVMKLNLFCKYRHKIYEWFSQPIRKEGPAPGDILISAAVLCSGQTYHNFNEICKFINLNILNQKAFNFIENRYIIPRIRELWLQEQNDILNQCRSKLHLNIIGKSVCKESSSDSNNCCYNFIDAALKKVITLSVLNSLDINKVTNIKAESCHRCLQKLSEVGVDISTLITDKDSYIEKLLHKNYPVISHQFDVWHFTQLFKKRLIIISRRHKILYNWIPFLCNHLWWCAKNCKHSIIFLKEMWTSVLKHMCNIHEWTDDDHYKYYKQCDHELLMDADWLMEDSVAFHKLRKLITERKFLNNLKHLNEFCHYSDLEIYHSTFSKYIPKHLNLTYMQLEVRAQTAALINNWRIDETPNKTNSHELSKPTKKIVYSFSEGLGQWLLIKILANQQIVPKYFQTLLELVLRKRLESNNSEQDILEQENSEQMENNFIIKTIQTVAPQPILFQRDWLSGSEEDKRKKYRKYSNFALQQAVHKVCQEGWTVTRASREFQVPWSTIKGYVNKLCNENGLRISKFTRNFMQSSK